MSLEPLEKMADDVKQGDLIRVFLERSDYVGYRWKLCRDRVQEQLMLPEDYDILFCSLNPYGVTRMKGDSLLGVTCSGEEPIIREKIQFVGVNLKTQRLGNEHIRGYQVIERTECQEDD